MKRYNNYIFLLTKFVNSNLEYKILLKFKRKCFALFNKYVQCEFKLIGLINLETE